MFPSLPHPNCIACHCCSSGCPHHLWPHINTTHPPYLQPSHHRYILPRPNFTIPIARPDHESSCHPSLTNLVSYFSPLHHTVTMTSFPALVYVSVANPISYLLCQHYILPPLCLIIYISKARRSPLIRPWRPTTSTINYAMATIPWQAETLHLYGGKSPTKLATDILLLSRFPLSLTYPNSGRALSYL